jgi:hypothetical protein
VSIDLRRILIISLIVFGCSVSALVMAQGGAASQVKKLNSSAKETILVDGTSTNMSINGDISLRLISESCVCHGCTMADCQFNVVYEVNGHDIFLDLQNPREGSGAGGKLKCDDCQPLEARGVLTGLSPGEYVVHYRKSFTLEVN